MFSFATPQDSYYSIATVVIVVVAGFLCWALYEIASLVRKGNEAADEAKERVQRVERGVVSLVEKVSNVSQYLGFIAEGGKAMSGFLHRKEDRSTGKAKSKVRRRVEEDDEELSDMP